MLLPSAKTSGCVVATDGVNIQRLVTGSRVRTASCVVMKRLTTDGRVVGAVREVEQRGITLSSIVTWIAAIWRRSNRVHSWKKREAAKRQEHRYKYGVSIFHKRDFVVCFRLPNARN